MSEIARRTITVVTPCFNEEANVEECHASLAAVFAKSLPGYALEHVFCDNASTDGSVEVLRALAAADPTVKVVVNARNYGPFRSTFNGLRHATGDAVVVMFAADLQDPPEVVADFVREWEAGAEVVFGVRNQREEGLVMRGVRKTYYRMVSRFAGIDIPLDVGEFQLIDRKVLAALLEHDDYYPYIRGMIANCGFRTKGVPYVWRARKRGLSKNRLYHLVDQGLNGLISFTNLPMRIAMFAGFGIALLSFLYALFTIAANLIAHGGLTVPGIPTLIVALFFFGGVQLMFLGIIGEYVSAIHFQVRKRPLVVERELINLDEARPGRD
ncbi:MAG: glycosyltransferase family 2 protein [Betaproteobacteria bacterium]|nr:glycosyltransferase family 2 protein [Betaproteobacteria bacterium]